MTAAAATIKHTHTTNNAYMAPKWATFIPSLSQSQWD